MQPLERDLPSAVEIVRLLGGRAHHRELLRHTTDQAVRRAVAGGDLIRAARGTYVLAGLPQPLVEAAACRGVVSHESAAALLGLELIEPPRMINISVPRGARPPVRKGVRVHRRELPAGDIDGSVTTLIRTVMDCCRSLTFPEALAVADSAARSDPGVVQELRAVAGAATWGPGKAQRVRVAREATALAANPFESALRAILIEAGIAGFEPQVTIRTPRATMRVDLADVRRRIVLEAEGFRWHGDPRRLAEDCRRYDELVLDGWLVLRRRRP